MPDPFALAALLIAPVPEAAQFGDWIVACDNGHHCEALAAADYDHQERGWAAYVTRAASPDARPRVSLSPIFGIKIEAARIELDGRPTSYRIDAQGQLVGDPTAFLVALARARTGSLIDTTGRTFGILPAAGASAALRWIDDRQGRAGTVTALIATGSLPASRVPPAPALPRIVHAPPSDAAPRALTATDRAAIMQFGDCDPDAGEVETFRLDAGHTLALIGCWRGAYQGSSVVVVIDELGRWQPAPLEQPEPVPADAEAFWPYLVTEAYYQPPDRLLRGYAKYRGLADGGTSASWSWDGTIFRLASYHELDQCRGGPPGTFLSRWQTANDPVDPDE